MIRPDLEGITKAELRAYVVAHPDDKDAFRIFVDRFTAEASVETFPLPQSPADLQMIENLIRQKVQQSQTSGKDSGEKSYRAKKSGSIDFANQRWRSI